MQILTGRASMLPRYAFGYIQSKERYNSAQELIDVKNKFKEKKIPIDCLVQDWYTWEEGKWGQNTQRYRVKLKIFYKSNKNRKLML